MVKDQIIKMEESNNLVHKYIPDEFNENMMFDISVVVCSYNPTKEALFFTLSSIINQKGIEVEIIIADDGSKVFYKDDIIAFFEKNKFENWKIVCNEVNHGTVYNVYSALKACNSRYVKLISPGDALYGDTVLKRWMDFQYEAGCKWSFADAIYYKNQLNGQIDLVCQAHPNNVKPYLKKDKNTCRWNYIVLDDIALGACVFCETKLAISYVSRIVNQIVYAEDNIWRMMMFDGIVGGYFPCNAVLYEYGTGISTGGNNIWTKRIKKDWDKANELMIQNKKLDNFQKAVVNAWKVNEENNKIKKTFIRGKLKHYIVSKLHTRKTLKRDNL